MGKMPEVGVSLLVHAFWEETGIQLAVSCVKLLGASPEGCIQKEGEGPGSLYNYLCG